MQLARDGKKNQVFTNNLVFAQIRGAAWALAILLSLGLESCAGASERFWQFGVDETLSEVVLPAEGAPRPGLIEADLDGDGISEFVCLAESAVRIQAAPCEKTDPDAPRWQSPQGWRVVQFGLADLDGSGVPEVSLLVWRPFEPWPIDRILLHPGRIESHQNADGMSCHVILIGWRGGQFREIWAGSALADPLLALASADLDRDGRPELTALESVYDAAPGDPARALTIWGWNGFGFDLLARTGGRFYEMSVYETPGGAVYLMTR